MTMHTGQMNTYNNRRAPMMQAVRNLEASKEILRSDKQEDFITVLNFLDDEQATAFAQCLYKCIRHGLSEHEKRYWLIAKSRVAVKGHRAKEYEMLLSQQLVAEYYGGSGNGNNGKRSKSNDD